MSEGMVTLWFSSDKCLNVRNIAAESRASKMKISNQIPVENPKDRCEVLLCVLIQDTMLVREDISLYSFSVLGPTGIERWGHLLWEWPLAGAVLLGRLGSSR